MEPIYFIFIAIIAGVIVWQMFFGAPEPLPVSPDDPLMLTAISQAQESLDICAKLSAKTNSYTLLKCRYTTDTGEKELLWGELRSPAQSLTTEEDAEVLLLNYPVTQKAELEQLQRFSHKDIVDWQVDLPDDEFYGAFTQRAMFAIAERDNIKLSHALRKEKAHYQGNPLPPKQG